MKEIKDNTNKWERYTMFLNWKNQHCGNQYLSKEVYRFNAISIKSPMAFSTELEQKIVNL